MTSQQAISSQTSAPSPASNPNLNPAAKPAVGGNSGFQWGQSGTGSVSIAYGAVMQLMALMTQIQSMNSQQAGYSTQAAGYAAKAAYDQSIGAAKQSQKAGILNAATSFVSGGLAILGAGVSAYSTASSHSQISELNKEKTQLDDFNTKLTARNTARPTTVASTETADDIAGSNRARLSTEGANRITQLTSHASSVKNLANAQRDNNTGHANEQTLNKDAIACMTPEEAKAFGEKLNTAEKINSESTHNVYSQMQTTQQNINLMKETITGITNGSLTVVSTGYTTQEKTDQANASLQQAQSQQLYGMYNNQAQQATQNQAKVLEALQILAQLNQVRA
jgi:hypothetical protein